MDAVLGCGSEIQWNKFFLHAHTYSSVCVCTEVKLQTGITSPRKPHHVSKVGMRQQVISRIHKCACHHTSRNSDIIHLRCRVWSYSKKRKWKRKKNPHSNNSYSPIKQMSSWNFLPSLLSPSLLFLIDFFCIANIDSIPKHTYPQPHTLCWVGDESVLKVRPDKRQQWFIMS